MKEQINIGCKRRPKVKDNELGVPLIINIIEARGGMGLVTTNILGWVYLLDRRGYVSHFGRRRVI